MGSNIDLRKYQDPAAIEDVFSKVVSGRSGYKSLIERKKALPKCTKCGKNGEEGQKFCSECGGKMMAPLTKCPGCKKNIVDNEIFCTECGHNLAAARAGN